MDTFYFGTKCNISFTFYYINFILLLLNDITYKVYSLIYLIFTGKKIILNIYYVNVYGYVYKKENNILYH